MTRSRMRSLSLDSCDEDEENRDTGNVIKETKVKKGQKKTEESKRREERAYGKRKAGDFESSEERVEEAKKQTNKFG